MNQRVLDLFNGYRNATDNPVVAALLTVADVLLQSQPETIVVEPEECDMYTVREAAARLNLSSRQVYQKCLAGQMRCVAGLHGIRIPLDEIERIEGARC